MLFFIKDKVAGGELHSVNAEPLLGETTMENHPESLEWQDMLEAMGGERTTCRRFYELVANERLLSACMSREVFSGTIRVRMLARWLEKLAHYYDDWDGRWTHLHLDPGGSERPEDMVPCEQIARLAIEYLEKYNDPSFDAVSDKQFEYEGWEEKYDLNFRLGGTILAMYDSTGYEHKIPNDEAQWTSEHATRYYAWCVASIADYLVRAVSWWPGIGRTKAGESSEVEEEIQRAFTELLHLLDSRLKFMKAHAETPEHEEEGKVDGIIFILNLFRAAAKVTQQHVKDL